MHVGPSTGPKTRDHLHYRFLRSKQMQGADGLSGSCRIWPLPVRCTSVQYLEMCRENLRKAAVAKPEASFIWIEIDSTLTGIFQVDDAAEFNIPFFINVGRLLWSCFRSWLFKSNDANLKAT